MKLTRVLLAALLVPAGIALAACGSDDDVLLDDGLVQPPPVTSSSGGASSGGASSSGAAVDPAGQPGASSSSSSSSSSGAPVETDCSPTADLSQAVVLTEFPPGAGWVRLTGDELTAYFTEGPKIYSMTRPTRAEPFGPGVELGPTVNKVGGSWAPFPSDDGLSIRFTHANRSWQAERSTRAEAFGESSMLPASIGAEVVTRDNSMQIYSRWEQGRWVLYAQPTAATSQIRLGGPAVATWYEPATRRMWVDAFGDGAYVSVWNGSWQHQGAQNFHVTWISPNACREYGILDGKVQVKTRLQ